MAFWVTPFDAPNQQDYVPRWRRSPAEGSEYITFASEDDVWWWQVVLKPGIPKPYCAKNLLESDIPNFLLRTIN